MSEEPATTARATRGPKVVALGGGHGLFATLSALRHVTDRLTAVVTVADDGGSSGRLRAELGVLPPGDLRMALAALCGDDEWGETWSRVVQHRFHSSGGLHKHAVGNLLIVALWELLGNTVAGLDWVGELLGAQGRVLPAAAVPLDIVAEVEGADPVRPWEVSRVQGQVACATTPGRVRSVSLIPPDPPAVPEAVAAVRDADWIVLGPGSWFTSVLPHLLVPELARALVETAAQRLVTLNLAPQPGETEGFTPHSHLEVLGSHAAEYAADFGVDIVLSDVHAVTDCGSLQAAARSLGARLVLEDVAAADGSPRHDTDRLAAAYARILGCDQDLPAGQVAGAGIGQSADRASGDPAGGQATGRYDPGGRHFGGLGGATRSTAVTEKGASWHGDDCASQG